LVVVPSPSSPEEFRPQHFTVPADNNAQVCEPRTAIAVTPVSPTTVTGESRGCRGAVAELTGAVERELDAYIWG
jgi:hypothetical protein